MGLKVVQGSVAETNILLTQIGERVTKHVFEVLKEGGDLIARTAQTMTPIEHGDLREAIKATTDREGINRRIRVRVDIDPDAVDELGKSVLQYGRIMNEALEPYGSGGYKLGPLSRPLADAGAPIGGKFMQRALKEHKKNIIERATAMAKRALARR